MKINQKKSRHKILVSTQNLTIEFDQKKSKFGYYEFDKRNYCLFIGWIHIYYLRKHTNNG